MKHTKESRQECNKLLGSAASEYPSQNIYGYREKVRLMEGRGVTPIPHFSCAFMTGNIQALEQDVYESYTKILERFRKPILLTFAWYELERVRQVLSEGKFPLLRELMTTDSACGNYRVGLFVMEYPEEG